MNSTTTDVIVITTTTTSSSSSSNSSPWGDPLTVDFNRLTVPINGFVVPVVVLLTLVSNVIVCSVLSRPSMRGQTSNVLLLATAVTNTLTGLLPAPLYVHFFALGHYADWLPYDLCFLYSAFTDIIPTLFHTSSVWLTVALALQRYIVVVSKSQTLKRQCTTRNAWLTVVLILMVSGFSQTGKFLENIYSPVRVESQTRPGLVFTGCTEEYAPFTMVWGGAYFYSYYWFRIVFIHLLPCFLLVAINSVLVRTMNEATRRRNLLLGRSGGGGKQPEERLTAQSSSNVETRKSMAEYRKLTESNRATMMMVCVVGVCFVVELPLAILFFVVILQNHLESSLLDEESEKMASTLINLTILSSYQFNFFIYCTMSRQFRTIFKDLFLCTSRGTCCKTSAEVP